MNTPREHWGSRFGFLFAAIGSAIGLGILWKFPYTVGQNGGGLFLFTYLVCLFVVGIPLFIGELILGRASERAAVGSFQVLHREHTNWKIGGWLGVLASFLIMSFYSVIAGWGMSYVLMSLTGFYKNLSAQEINSAYQNLSESGGITLFWHFLFTLITMAIVFTGVRKGIEYWTKLMTRVFLVLIVGLFLYSITLPGFGEAFRFIFHPNLENFQMSSAIEALGLAFWTLSIGQGIMISYGSYMRHEEDVVGLAFLVAFAVIIVAILSSLMIFPVVFSFGLPPQAGPGLIFKTLPFLFAKLPGALFISTIFFVLFVFTALTSAIPLVEVVATNFMELFQIPRRRAVILTALATFIFGIPSALSQTDWLFANWKDVYGMDFLSTINEVVSSWVIPIGGLITSIFIGWIVDKEVLKQEFATSGKLGKLVKPWRFFVRYIVPVTILIIILQKSGLIDFDRWIHPLPKQIESTS